MKMSNEIDLAVEQAERLLSMHIKNHVERGVVGESAYECVMCYEDIPEKRRLIVMGTQHCIACAEYLERKKV